jgi:hypothetical protein
MCLEKRVAAKRRRGSRNVSWARKVRLESPYRRKPENDLPIEENPKTHFVPIKGEGHTGYFNRPGQFNRALGNFLAHMGETGVNP